MNYSVVLTNINDIKIGDTVEINGELKTVGRNNIQYDSFLGRTLFGDSFTLGHAPVRKAIINQAKTH